MDEKWYQENNWEESDRIINRAFKDLTNQIARLQRTCPHNHIRRHTSNLPNGQLWTYDRCDVCCKQIHSKVIHE